ncbi:PspC domain-containing protein [Robiginitomaculum antarcticum]|uniref:PspC domain-containing protein n=1 Tax=Robiginitomaculum antarcticum TaxID=437507 RepID=UPI00037E82D2|nr:PspC domain-containing protein [Robiginitomaculum antarcticum]
MTKRYKNRFHRAMNDTNWGTGEHEDVEYVDDVPKRLTRNKIDGVWGGVCAGIGDYSGIDPVIVRLLFVLAFFFLLGPLVFAIYFGLWIFVPSDNRAPYRRKKYETRKARRAERADLNITQPVKSTATFKDVRSKFRSVETRLADLEKSITSSEWQLRRQFRDLEN